MVNEHEKRSMKQAEAAAGEGGEIGLLQLATRLRHGEPKTRLSLHAGKAIQQNSIDGFLKLSRQVICRWCHEVCTVSPRWLPHHSGAWCQLVLRRVFLFFMHGVNGTAHRLCKSKARTADLGTFSQRTLAELLLCLWVAIDSPH
jgi:hypothetical protein